MLTMLRLFFALVAVTFGRSLAAFFLVPALDPVGKGFHLLTVAMSPLLMWFLALQMRQMKDYAAARPSVMFGKFISQTYSVLGPVVESDQRLTKAIAEMVTSFLGDDEVKQAYHAVEVANRLHGHLRFKGIEEYSEAPGIWLLGFFDSWYDRYLPPQVREGLLAVGLEELEDEE